MVAECGSAQVDQLAKVEHVLSDQAAEAGAKADIAEASMHVAEDEYNDAQAKIAKIESDVPAYGKEKVEEMLKLNCDKVEDLDRAIAALVLARHPLSQPLLSSLPESTN